jgi:hypothetical protein
MATPAETYNDAELAAATDRAYREAVRSWREWYGMEASRPKRGTPEYGDWAAICAMLHASADSADAFHAELKREQRRRTGWADR